MDRFPQGPWPGLAEGVWSVVALRRWWRTSAHSLKLEVICAPGHDQLLLQVC